jgi:CDP-diacylglycerol--glycerol-3-phosphate 3-phosphatidyltransferase
MKITANKVTLTRILLLPIPCALLFGGPWERGLALLFYILIGLTDYLDGYLARRDGPTPLGALIDPMADKVYVTTMFVPMAAQGVIPIWMLLLLLMREYLVTELRSIHGSKGVKFKTSELAKYKTAIQMIAGGAIICMDIFRGSNWVFAPLGAFWASTVAMNLIYYRSTKTIGDRSVAFFVLASFAIILRATLHYLMAIWILMAVVLAITLLSGLSYSFQTWRSLGSHILLSFGTKEWVSFLGLGLAFPLIYVSSLYWDDTPVGLVIAILSAEFAMGGLKNSLITLGPSSPYMPQPLKALLMDGMGIAALFVLIVSLPHHTFIVNGLLLAVFVGSIAEGIRLFYHHRQLILGRPVCMT